MRAPRASGASTSAGRAAVWFLIPYVPTPVLDIAIDGTTGGVLEPSGGRAVPISSGTARGRVAASRARVSAAPSSAGVDVEDQRALVEVM